MFVNELNCTVTFQNGATFIAPPRFNGGRQGESLATKVVMLLKNLNIEAGSTLGYHFEIIDGLGVKHCSEYFDISYSEVAANETVSFEIPKSITKAGGIATLYVYITIAAGEVKREYITPGLELDFNDVEAEKIPVSENEETQYRELNILLQQAQEYANETAANLIESTDALAEIKDIAHQSEELFEEAKKTLEGKADKSEIPQKVSQLENDKGYLVADDIKSNTDKNNILNYITYKIYIDEYVEIASRECNNEVGIIGCDANISGAQIIPDTIEGYPVTVIDSYAFKNCTKLTSIVLPDSVTEIGYSAFSGCTALESVILPECLTYIGPTVFSGCTKLKSIEIPNGVTSIDDTAFENCTALTSVIIPASVTLINYSFNGCTSLKDIYYGGTKEDWDNADMCLWWIESVEDYNYDTFKDDVTIHYKYGDVPTPTENTDAANKEYIDNIIGDIDASLDGIIDIQNSFILPSAEDVTF